MSKIDRIQSLVRIALEQRTYGGEPARAYSRIDAMLASLISDTDMKPSEIDRGIRRVSFRVREDDGNSISYTIEFARHPGGVVPIPHECHKTIMLCEPIWNDPFGSVGEPPDDYGACVEITFPWPCPDDPQRPN